MGGNKMNEKEKKQAPNGIVLTKKIAKEARLL